MPSVKKKLFDIRKNLRGVEGKIRIRIGTRRKRTSGGENEGRKEEGKEFEGELGFPYSS